MTQFGALILVCVFFIIIEVINGEGETKRFKRQSVRYECPSGFRVRRTYSCRQEDRGHSHEHHQARSVTRPYRQTSTLFSPQSSGFSGIYRPYPTRTSSNNRGYPDRGRGGGRRGYPYSSSHSDEYNRRRGGRGYPDSSSHSDEYNRRGGRGGGRVEKYKEWIDDCCYHPPGHHSHSHEYSRERITPPGNGGLVPGIGGGSGILGGLLGGLLGGKGGSRSSRCYSKEDNGYRCRSVHASNRYYYDYRSGACRTFYHLGCGGNSNNFKSYSECQRYCR